MRRRTNFLLLVAAFATMLSGCGTVDEGQNARQAAERAVKREARERVGDFAATPAYLETTAGKPVIDQLRERGSAESKRITGVVRTRIDVAPVAGKTELLRAPAAGGEVQISNRFSVRVRRDGDRWIVPPDSVEIEPVLARSPTRSALALARQTGLGAIRALLTWPGNRKAYDRAQDGRYATVLASDGNFGERGFDPTPSLVLEDKAPAAEEPPAGDEDLGTVPGLDAPLDAPSDVPPGAAWPRSADGGEDDTPLRSVLAQEPGRPDCERFDLRALKPTKITGTVTAGGDDPETIDVETGDLPDGVTETAYVTGTVSARAGNWESRSRYATCFGRRVTSQDEPIAIGRRSITVPYTIELSRSMAGPGREWYITLVRLGSDDAFETGEGVETVYSVDDSG